MNKSEVKKLMNKEEVLAVGTRDDKDFISYKGKVYSGPSIDDAESPEEHYANILTADNEEDF